MDTKRKIEILDNLIDELNKLIIIKGVSELKFYEQNGYFEGYSKNINNVNHRDLVNFNIEIAKVERVALENFRDSLKFK